MFKLLVVIWFTHSNRANTSHVLEFDDQVSAERAYDNLRRTNKESHCIMYEITKLF